MTPMRFSERMFDENQTPEQTGIKPKLIWLFGEL